MINFITQSTQIGLQHLQNQLRTITFHPNQFISNKLAQWNQQQQQRQHLFLKNICKKYATYQRQKIRQKSSQQIQIKLKQLKHHLRQTISKSTIEKIMSQKDNKHQHYLDKVLKVKTENVDIGKKYNKKINMKLDLLLQADQIKDQKFNYKKWYNQCKNNPKLNPNLHKINYILQKQQKFGRNARQNIRRSMGDQILLCRENSYKKKKKNYNISSETIKRNT